MDDGMVREASDSPCVKCDAKNEADCIGYIFNGSCLLEAIRDD